MITPEQETSLDGLSQLFLHELEGTFPSEEWEATFTDRLEVVIPATDARFGEIHVWLDADEVTVGIGQFFHTHFETYLDDSLSKSEANRQAATGAIEFIQGVVSDRFVLVIYYKGEDPTQARVIPLGEKGRDSRVMPIGQKTGFFQKLFPPKERIVRCLWSGKEIES